MSYTPLKTEDKYDLRWIYNTIFANIAMGPLSTIIVLYILETGGGVIEASYAITAGTVISIPASYVWGKISDLYQRRRAQIIISYIGLAGSLLALYFISNVLDIILIYALYSFLITANAAPLNLLVMETSPKDLWSRVFSKLQLAGSVGGSIGFAFAFVITDVIALKFLILILFFISLISVVTSAIYVPEPVKKMDRTIFLFDLSAFLSRMYTNSILFIKATNVNIIKIIRSFKLKNNSTISKLYFAIFLFFIGSGLFNTVYPAGLKQSGISESTIFLVIFTGMIVQTITFYYLGSKPHTISTSKSLYSALFLRGGSYLMIGIIFILFRYFIFYSNIIFYPLASGIGFSIYYTVSSVMVFQTIGESARGKSLGAYSAIIGIGTLIGALLSGYLSYYIGYWFTFILAGITVLSSYFFFSMIKFHG
jgi:MFS family permease